MFARTDVSAVAHITPSARAHLALLQLGDSDWQLARNPNISEEAWMIIWERRTPKLSGKESVIPSLIHTATTDAELARVLAEAPRDEIISAALVRGSQINPTLARKLCEKLYSSPEFDEMDAAACLLTGNLDPNLVQPFLNKVLDSVETTEYPYLAGDTDFFLSDLTEVALTLYDSITDQDAIDILESFPESNALNARVLDYRPPLLPLMLKSNRAEYFYSAVASSRHLFEPEATRLLGEVLLQIPFWEDRPNVKWAIANLTQNPNVSFPTRLTAHRSLLSASDPHSEQGTREELMERTLAEQKAGWVYATSPWEHTNEREQDVVNRHIARSGYHTSDLFPSLENHPKFKEDHYSYQPNGVAFSKKEIVEKITPELDALGPDAWSLFVAMLPGWELSYEELITTISSMS